MALSEKEKKVLKTLSNKGAMTPQEVSVQTLMMPDEVDDTVNSLSEDGYIRIKELKGNTLLKEALLLSKKGRATLRLEKG